MEQSDQEIGAADHSYDLLTVDVWDTLLRRRCHPDAIKLHLCRYILNNFWYLLPEAKRDHWVLLQARLLAEQMLAAESKQKGFDEEYLYHEVHQRWLELVGLNLSDIPPESRDNLAKTLEKIELEQELYVTYPDPLVKNELAKYKATKICFLSDFYFPASHLHKLLCAHGFGDVVESGIVSCDVKLNKRSGRLFRHVHDIHELEPHQHIHMGDNPYADVESPRRLGIKSIHYLPEQPHKTRKLIEAGFKHRLSYVQQAIDGLLGSSPESSLPVGSEPLRSYELGRRLSLLFFNFVLYITERAVADGVDKLFFFTREGEFFLRLYERIKERNVLGHSIPDASLLEVSRVATFAGSLRQFSCTELMRIWNQYSIQSLAALFSSLDIDPKPFSPSLQAFGLDLQELITYPWLDERVTSLFADSDFSAGIASVLEKKRASLLAYLFSNGLDEKSMVTGVVDIGWRGTIQDNLAYLLPNTKFHGYYLSLNRFLNIQPENCHKTAFGPDLNKASSPFDFLLDYVSPIEMLCNSPNGSVQSYGLAENGVQVNKLTDSAENKVYQDYVCYFQQGVLDSMGYWADFSRTHAYTAEELKPVALQVWADLIKRPDPIVVKAYLSLNHNEVFGTGVFAKKGEMPRLSTVMKAYILPRQSAKLQKFILEMGWFPALLSNPDVNPILRMALRGFTGVSMLHMWIYKILQKLRVV